MAPCEMPSQVSPSRPVGAGGCLLRSLPLALTNCRNNYSLNAVGGHNTYMQRQIQALTEENEGLRKRLAKAESVIREHEATIRKLQLKLPAKQNKLNFECLFDHSSQDDEPATKSVCEVGRTEGVSSPRPLQKKYCEMAHSPRIVDKKEFQGENSQKISHSAYSPWKTGESNNTHRNSTPCNSINVAMSDIMFNRLSSNKIIDKYIVSASDKMTRTVKKKEQSAKKQIFNSFFVTGIDEKCKPIIQYSYPKMQERQKVVLELFYGQSSVQAQTKQQSRPIKDRFIMPLLKEDEQEGWDYLVGCETDGIQNNKVFPRLYCFITNCQLITQLQALLASIVHCMHSTKSNLPNALHNRLTDPLSFLQSTPITQGMVVDLKLDSQLKFSAEWKRYFPEAALNRIVHFTQHGSSLIETALYGIISVYMLAEVKVILYSTTKARLSDTILAVLEVIKPIEYVHPIIMALLTPDHQHFVHSPVPLLLGLYSEPSRKNKKLEIVFNQKEGTCNLIERGLMKVPDGILIHLDTGLVFGEALREDLNEVAICINALKDKVCRNPKNTSRLFSKLIKEDTESPIFKEAQNALKEVIKKTQLYSYYMQKNNK